MLRVVIGKVAEIRLTIFPATWLKLYTYKYIYIYIYIYIYKITEGNLILLEKSIQYSICEGAKDGLNKK